MNRTRVFRVGFLLLYSVLLIALWDAFVRVFKIRPYMIPSPVQVFSKMYANWPLFLENTMVTGVEAGVGILLGFAVGIVLAFLMSSFRVLNKVLEPLVIMSQTFPKEALAPLFLVWFGFGVLPKILIAALISFFPVAINTVKGLTTIEFEYGALMRTLGATPWQVFVKLRLPYAVPYIVSSLRMCATLSVIGAVVGEFVGSSAGLGHMIRAATAEIATEVIFGALIMLALVGLCFYGLALGIERFLFSKYFFGRDFAAEATR